MTQQSHSWAYIWKEKKKKQFKKIYTPHHQDMEVT